MYSFAVVLYTWDPIPITPALSPHYPAIQVTYLTVSHFDLHPPLLF